jgi:hypothetical protein
MLSLQFTKKDQHMPRINNSEFAKVIGVNEGNVRRAIKAGRIIVGEDGLIDVESQVERYNLTRDRKRVHDGQPKAKGRPKTATTADAQSETVKTLRSLAELEEREAQLRVALMEEKLARERGASVNREQTRRACAAFSRLVRDKWVDFGNRHGQQIASAIGANPKLVMAELDKAVRLQLDEIANVQAPLP